MQFGLFGGARTKRSVGIEDSQGYQAFIDAVPYGDFVPIPFHFTIKLTSGRVALSALRCGSGIPPGMATPLTVQGSGIRCRTAYAVQVCRHSFVKGICRELWCSNLEAAGRLA